MLLFWTRPDAPQPSGDVGAAAPGRVRAPRLLAARRALGVTPPRATRARDEGDAATPTTSRDRVEVEVDVRRFADPSRKSVDVYLVDKRERFVAERWAPSLYPPDTLGAPPHVVVGTPEQVRGHWVCARAWDGPPVFFDGDHWRGERVHLVLEPAPTTEVRIRTSDGRPFPAGVGVEVRSEPPDGAVHAGHPGPDVFQWYADNTAVASEGGGSEASYRRRFGTRAPVRVEVTAPGCYAEPASILVGPDRGTFDVVLHPSARLSVAPRGLPLEGSWFRVEIVDAVGVANDALPVCPEDPASEDVYVVAEGLRPGRYTATVSAHQFVPRVVEFEVTGSGQSLRIEPTMVPVAPMGRLAIDARFPRGYALVDPKHVGLFELYLRAAGGGDWQTPDWYREDWQRGSCEVCAQSAGRYDLLLWETHTDAVAFVADVRIDAGRTTPLTVSLERGTHFSMVALGAAGLRWDDDIRFHAPDLGRLPIRAGGISGLICLDCVGGFEKASAGPYPCGRLEADIPTGGRRRRVELPSR